METGACDNSLVASTIALEQARPSATRSTQDTNTEDTERVVERIQHELQLLLQERAAIVKRIGVIKDTLVGLADVFGADIINEELQDLLFERSPRRTPRSHPGLTDACRRTLMELSQPLTTRQLCDRIQEVNPSVLVGHKQPMASVSVVLRRLVSYGEVQDGVNEKDGRTWLWIGPRQRDEAAEDSSLPPLKHEPTSNEPLPADTKG